ncbi:MAG: glutamate mutase L [Anaerolineales bacterium]|nr:glutamate mutase L [Anaerolineales bacterium]
MATSIVAADSVLAIDVGEVTTRAILFDVVDGHYRFIAGGAAPTTVNAPYNDIWEGIRDAIDHLQAVTGRVLVGSDEQLITPSRLDGSGVDKLAATFSAGKPLRVIAAGLLGDVSLQSACRLATTTYSQVVESIGLNDRRKVEERVRVIQSLNPDLILIAGGTDGGASQAVHKLIEPIGLACYFTPEARRPELLFTGNEAISGEVRNTLERTGAIHIAPNVRPTLESEHIDAAHETLADLFQRIRGRQIPGVIELDQRAEGGLLPTASATGRVVRFLSQIYGANKGVMSVDVGASSTSLAAAVSGELALGVYPQFGLGASLAELLQHCPLEDVTRWLHCDIPAAYVQDYLQNKALYPSSLPATEEDLDIEQALARQMMRLSLRQFRTLGGPVGRTVDSGMVTGLEPVLALGSVLTQAPKLAESMLMLLDGLQPTGVTTFVLDQNHLIPGLGAAAASNPILAVQVLESGALLNLGTVISPVGNARYGTPILRVRMTVAGGHEARLEVKYGSLIVLPLPVGQSAQLQLRPLQRFDVGMGGGGRGGSLRVTGGALGLIIDARGRPLQLSKDPARRREMIKRWIKLLNG